jgi:hypothetical protein
MELVKKLPLTPSGHVDMTAHYSACRQAADCITTQIISESDQQRAGRDPLVAETARRCKMWMCLVQVL